jgi:hypothetical protein
VETFAIYADWRCTGAVHEDALATISSGFRPDDEGVCLWIDEKDPALLKLSLDVVAEDYEEAGRMGRRLAHEAVALAHLPGELIALSACTEEGQAVWSEPEQLRD